MTPPSFDPGSLFLPSVADRILLEGPRPRLAEARTLLRVVRDFLKGFRVLHFVGPCVTVFGSARTKESDPSYQLARKLGAGIAELGFTVMTGGGPGIMEAANRGAKEAGGESIGLNIKLPMEQKPNPYITPQLSFIFRYFFMRKLWFAQPAKAFIAFPGGYGTMDELWEFLTLEQTHKITHQATIMLYGTEFWKKAINFDSLLEAGTVTKEDMKLICFADDPQKAFEILRHNLSRELGARTRIRHPFF
jgi:uncharacterized protein (TIGR00730 family)